MAAAAYLSDGSPLRARDAYFTEVISQQMRVPERLRVGSEERSARREEPPPAYSMHVPDRLALTDTPDLSPRPLFSKQSATAHALSMWDLQHGGWEKEVYTQEHVQSPLRRSYSDQTFGRTPPGTPTHSKQALHTPSVNRRAGRSPAVPIVPAVPSPRPNSGPDGPDARPSLLSAESVLQAARQLGQQASQKILQTVAHKYSSRFKFPENPPPQPLEETRKSALQESWLSPEEESGTAVELIVLRRQVLKMSRRIAGLERQNADRKQTEVMLFSLLLSACFINGWLWMRR